MKNFKEIAEKCLSGELSGTFICKLRGRENKIQVSSKNLLKFENLYKLKYPYPYTYDKFDENGFSTPYGNNQVINFIPDMNKNDKRTIQISLQQAREWYKSGNDTLHTLALSAYSEKELDLYPRTWIEYLQIHPEHQGITIKVPNSISIELLNYTTLLLLRKEWIHIWSQEQGLKEDWDKILGHAIELDIQNNIFVTHSLVTNPLKFPTHELAIDFRNTFKDLLNSAKGLY